jgi:prophage maintenance system killer protein
MWYPTLPDLVFLYEKVCAVQEVEAQITEMSAVDEAILAPQRTATEERSQPVIARKMAAFIVPLVRGRPFANCNDRVSHSMAQRFADRNGFTLQVAYPEMVRAFDTLRGEDLSLDSFADWLQSSLKSRFDSAHRERLFASLNQLAQVKEEVEDRPGLQDLAERIDAVGYTLTHQIGTLFRVKNGDSELRDRFPLFWDAWSESLSQER